MPVEKAVKVAVGEVELVIVPLPDSKLQVVAPIEALPESIAVPELMQIVWFGPAVAVVGAGSTCTITVALLLGPPHGLLKVQARILVPVANPNTVVVGLKIFVIVPLPVENDQLPTPTGAVAFSVTLGELAQTVWLVPALATPATPATIS